MRLNTEKVTHAINNLLWVTVEFAVVQQQYILVTEQGLVLFDVFSDESKSAVIKTILHAIEVTLLTINLVFDCLFL